MARRRRTDARDRAIWDAYVCGRTQEDIAAEHGISHQRVSQIIAEVRAEIPPETLAESRARYAALYDQWLVKLSALIDAAPIPAYSAGRLITDADGNAAEDHAGRITAMRTALSVTESARKMLGVDQATKTEVEATVTYAIEGVDLRDLT